MHDNNETSGSSSSTKLQERITFFFVAVGVAALTYAIFALADFLPEKKATPLPASPEVATKATSTEELKTETPKASETVVDALPVAIVFDALGGKEVSVLNPESTSVDALDSALLKGVVRHPESADFKNTGTIFLLGHSSYLPVVHNKNFQAFNGIQKLKWGDTIRLRSKNTEYVYSVERVYEAKATDAEVEIGKGEARLILATCNSFATKNDRFIVEARLVGSHPLNINPVS